MCWTSAKRTLVHVHVDTSSESENKICFIVLHNDIIMAAIWSGFYLLYI